MIKPCNWIQQTWIILSLNVLLFGFIISENRKILKEKFESNLMYV